MTNSSIFLRRWVHLSGATLRIFQSVAFMVLIPVADAFAQATPDFNDPDAIAIGFQNFANTVDSLISTAITSSTFSSQIDILWTVFAVLLLMWTTFQYTFRGAQLLDIASAMVLILIVRALMASYDFLTSAIWQAGDGVGEALQMAMIGTGDLFFAPAFLAKLIQSITFPSGPLGIAAGIAFAMSLLVVSIAMLLLSILSYVASIWGLWGFALAKLIGLAFVPFVMYQRLSFLFDGWLRFFFGFVIYAVIARLNLVLVAVAVALYFSVPMPPSVTNVVPTALPAFAKLSELLGLLTFVLVGILALFSTGRFAATLIAGAGGGGMGMAAHSAARGIAGFALGKK